MEPLATQHKQKKPAAPVRQPQSSAKGQHPVVRSVLRSKKIQPKLHADPVNDKYEQEADRFAEQVVNMPAGENPVAISRDAVREAPALGTTARVFIVEDNAEQLQAGQMHKSEFLALIQESVREAVEPILAGVGRSTSNCPYLNFVFKFLDRRNADYIDRTLRSFGSDLPDVSSADSYIPMVVDRVRQSTLSWVRTGEISGLPESIPGTIIRTAVGEESTPTSNAGDVQPKAKSGGARLDYSPAAVLSMLGPGRSLDSAVTSRMGPALGANLSHVRMHNDAVSAKLSAGLNARAFTVGNHIAFGSGEYHPGTPIGDALIAHELAHVAQQRYASDLSPAQTEGGSGNDDFFEKDADRSAIGAIVSLWSRGTMALSDLALNAMPQLRSGLQLRRCSIDEVDEFEEEHEALRQMSPEDLIARYTTGAGDLDEDALGALLARMAWYTPAHYDFVIRLFRALPSTDRDDVAASMVANTSDADLADLAQSEAGRALLEELVPELRGGWTTGGETFAAIRVLRALRARSAAEDAAQVELERLEALVEATGAPVSTTPAESLGRADLGRRLRLIEVSLNRIAENWGSDRQVTEAVEQVRSRIPGIRGRLGRDALLLSSRIPEGQLMLETFESVLPRLDEQIRNTHAEAGTEDANRRLIVFVRERFVEALGSVLGDDALQRFAQASTALTALSTARLGVSLAVLRERPGLFEDVASELAAMNDFAGWLVEQIHAFDAEGAAVAAADGRGEDTTARREAAQQRYEILTKSLGVLGHWDQAIQAAEALESGFSFTEVFYSSIDIDDIYTWLRQMAAEARAGNLAELSRRLETFESDERIREYYEDIPSILRSSGITVAIGVTLVAAAVTWGIGAAVAAPATAGATTTITAGSIAAGAGHVALEALVFTSVHRGLSEAVGLGSQGTFLEDFLWNFGLFGAMRIIGGAVGLFLRSRILTLLESGSFLRARQLMGRARPIQLGVAFGTLEIYGLARFSIETGRWPSTSELAEMTAHNVVIMAAIAGMHAAVSRFTPLGRFQSRYGARFEELELERLALERRSAQAVREGNLAEQEAELRSLGEDIQTRMRALIDQVVADPDMNLDALRTQLEAMNARQVAAGSLTQALGMPREVELQRSGGEFQFSYRQGETIRVVEGARALGASQVRTLTVEGRPTVVEALFDGRPAMLFVERPVEAAPPETTGPLPATATPQEQNALRLEAAKDALARRRIEWSQIPENLRGLRRIRPRGQSNPESIAETTRLLTELEAWIAQRPETPWRSANEVRIEAPVTEARTRLSEIPEGELRDYLQADDAAVVVFGALRQTTTNAAARMQTIWDAWVSSGQEGEFADFAESILIEEAVTALRSTGETQLADALEQDPRLQNAFGRMGYDLARLRDVSLYHEHGYRGQLTLAEYLQRQLGSLRQEGRAWGARRGRLVVPIPEDGYAPLRSRLTALRDAGTLTDVDVGILWRWNRMIRALIEESAARVPGNQDGTRAEVVMRFLFEGIGRDFSESAYRNFRHRIRQLIVDDVVYLRGGEDTSSSPAVHDGTPVRPWAEQLTRLELWEGRAPAGDSATIGALWAAYAEARFDIGLPEGSDVASIAVEPGRSLVIVGGRMGDAVLRVTGPLLDPAAPGSGEWAADYKGGEDPFDIDQAQNYHANIMANSGSFVMGRGTRAQRYRGLIYIFRNATAAADAASAIDDAGLHSRIKVAYFGEDGGLVWVR